MSEYRYFEPEPTPPPTWQNEALKEARAIGEQLKAMHDIQPSPMLNERGEMGEFNPPPSFCDLPLNKSSITY
jgi:hypothetical protein